MYVLCTFFKEKISFTKWPVIALRQNSSDETDVLYRNIKCSEDGPFCFFFNFKNCFVALQFWEWSCLIIVLHNLVLIWMFITHWFHIIKTSFELFFLSDDCRIRDVVRCSLQVLSQSWKTVVIINHSEQQKHCYLSSLACVTTPIIIMQFQTE